jgi:chromate transporter
VDEAEQETRRETVVGLIALLRIFTRIGCLSWGGGSATLAMMHHEFCVARRALSEEEFQVLFGISRLVPGMNLLSLTVLLGHRVHGLLGGLAALAALTVPSFTIIVLGCLFLRHIEPHSPLSGAVRGLGPAAAALLAHTGWQLARGTMKKQGAIERLQWGAVAALAGVAALWNVLPPAWIIIVGALVGVLARRRMGEGS